MNDFNKLLDDLFCTKIEAKDEKELWEMYEKARKTINEQEKKKMNEREIKECCLKIKQNLNELHNGLHILPIEQARILFNEIVDSLEKLNIYNICNADFKEIIMNLLGGIILDD